MRSSIGSRLIRAKPQATGVDEASAAIFCPQRPPPFRPMWRRARARQRIAIVGSCLYSRSRLDEGGQANLLSAQFHDCTDHALSSGWTCDLGYLESPNVGRFRCRAAIRAFSGRHSRTLHYRIRSLRPRKRLCQRSDKGRGDHAGEAPGRRSVAGSLQR